MSASSSLCEKLYLPLSPATGSAALLRPANFHPVYRLREVNPPEFRNSGLEGPSAKREMKGFTAAQRRGLAFEKKVRTALREDFHDRASFNARISFRDSRGWRRAEPDALLRLDGPVPAIIEVKTIHCARAWFQLVELYAPLIERLYGVWPILVEVCASYDPATRFPGPMGDLLLGREELRSFLEEAGRSPAASRDREGSSRNASPSVIVCRW